MEILTIYKGGISTAFVIQIYLHILITKPSQSTKTFVLGLSKFPQSELERREIGAIISKILASQIFKFE